MSKGDGYLTAAIAAAETTEIMDRLIREMTTKMAATTKAMSPLMTAMTKMAAVLPYPLETWRYGTIIHNRRNGEVAMFIGVPELGDYIHVLFLGPEWTYGGTTGTIPMRDVPDWSFYELMV